MFFVGFSAAGEIISNGIVQNAFQDCEDWGRWVIEVSNGVVGGKRFGNSSEQWESRRVSTLDCCGARLADVVYNDRLWQIYRLAGLTDNLRDTIVV